MPRGLPKSKREGPGAVAPDAPGETAPAAARPVDEAGAPPAARKQRATKRTPARAARIPYSAPGLAAESDLSAALDRILEAHERSVVKARGEPATPVCAEHEALERRLEELDASERRLRRELEGERLAARQAREMARRYQDDVRDALDRLLALRRVAEAPRAVATEPIADAAPAPVATEQVSDAAPAPVEPAINFAPRPVPGIAASLAQLASELRFGGRRGAAVLGVAGLALVGAVALAWFRPIEPIAPPEGAAAAAPAPSVAELDAQRELDAAVPPPPAVATRPAVATPAPSRPAPAPAPAPVPAPARQRRPLTLAERKLWETLTRDAVNDQLRFQATLGGEALAPRAGGREIETAILIESRDDAVSLNLDRLLGGLSLSLNGAPPVRARLGAGRVPTRVLGPPLAGGERPTRSLSFVVVFQVGRAAAGEADTVLALERPDQAPLRLLWPSRLLAETLLAKR